MQHLLFFSDGTVQKKDTDAKCFNVKNIDNDDRFVERDNVCSKQTDPNKQFSFSNIGKSTIYKYGWLAHLAKYVL